MRAALYRRRHPWPDRLEFADQGTLFLEEIGDIPLEVQLAGAGIQALGEYGEAEDRRPAGRGDPS